MSASTSAAPRTLAPRCGFEVESVDQRAVDEMGVMTWPGLEKRDAPFSQTAGADELLMCYVKEGTADDVVGFELINMAASLSGSDGGCKFMSHPPTAATLLRLLACPVLQVPHLEPCFPGGFGPASLDRSRVT